MSLLINYLTANTGVKVLGLQLGEVRYTIDIENDYQFEPQEFFALYSPTIINLGVLFPPNTEVNIISHSIDETKDISNIGLDIQATPLTCVVTERLTEYKIAKLQKGTVESTSAAPTSATSRAVPLTLAGSTFTGTEA